MDGLASARAVIGRGVSLAAIGFFFASVGNGILSFANVEAGGIAKQSFGPGSGLVESTIPALMNTTLGFTGFMIVTTLVVFVLRLRRDGPDAKIARELGLGTSAKAWMRRQRYGPTPQEVIREESIAKQEALRVILAARDHESAEVQAAMDRLSEAQARLGKVPEMDRAWKSGEHRKSVRRQQIARIMLSCVPLSAAATLVSYVSSIGIFTSTGLLTAVFGFWWFLQFAIGRLGARKKIDITRVENVFTTLFMMVGTVGIACFTAAAVPTQRGLSATLVVAECLVAAATAYAFGSIAAHERGDRARFFAIAVPSLLTSMGLPIWCAASGMRVWPFLAMVLASAFYGMRGWPQRKLSYWEPIGVPSLGSSLVYARGCVAVLTVALVVLYGVTVVQAVLQGTTIPPFPWFGPTPALGPGSQWTLPLILALMGFGQHQLSQVMNNAKFNPTVLNGFAQLVGGTVLLWVDYEFRGHTPQPLQIWAMVLVGVATMGLAILLWLLERRRKRRARMERDRVVQELIASFSP